MASYSEYISAYRKKLDSSAKKASVKGGITYRGPLDVAFRILEEIELHKELYRKGRISEKKLKYVYLKLRTKFYQSEAWKILRQSCRERYVGLCNRCGCVGHHAHHKLRIYTHPLRALDLNNLEFLCQSCHKKEHALS